VRWRQRVCLPSPTKSDCPSSDSFPRDFAPFHRRGLTKRHTAENVPDAVTSLYIWWHDVNRSDYWIMTVRYAATRLMQIVLEEWIHWLRL
jgi:hypothetical protein